MSNLKHDKITNQFQTLSLLLLILIKAKIVVAYYSSTRINDQGLVLKFCSFNESLPDFRLIAAD